MDISMAGNHAIRLGIKRRYKRWIGIGLLPDRLRAIRSVWRTTIGKIDLYFVAAAVSSFFVWSAESATGDTNSADSTGWPIIVIFALLFLLVILFIFGTINQMPRFNNDADPEALDNLIGIGTTHYLAAGGLTPLIVYITAIPDESLGWPISLMVAGIVLLNAVGVNFCVMRWNIAPAAQRDIGKMLLRVPTLLLLLLAAAAFQNRSLLVSLAVGLSILLLPLMFEAIVVIYKSRPVVGPVKKALSASKNDNEQNQQGEAGQNKPDSGAGPVGITNGDRHSSCPM